MSAHAQARLGAAENLAAGLHQLLSTLRAEAGAAAPAAAPPGTKAPPAESAFVWAPGEATRLSLFPIRHPELWQFRKVLEGLHWNAQEVDVSHDRRDWETRMTPDQRNFVEMQLAFFARIDIDVLRNLDENFGEEVDCLEARMAFAAQKDQECVHAESYAIQIETLVDEDRRDEVFNAARKMPVIANMQAWVLRWFDRGIPVGERLVAFAAVEGVLFSASFCALQWLRELNLLPGVTQYNEFIVRDEGIHTLLTCYLVNNHLRVRTPEARAHEIFRDAVENVLDEFVEKSLPVKLIGMNAALMKQYVRFQADSVLGDMGYSPIWRVGKNPLPFMEKQALNAATKTNFFERRPTQYQNVTAEGAGRLGVDDSPVDA